MGCKTWPDRISSGLAGGGMMTAAGRLVTRARLPARGIWRGANPRHPNEPPGCFALRDGLGHGAGETPDRSAGLRATVVRLSTASVTRRMALMSGGGTHADQHEPDPLVRATAALSLAINWVPLNPPVVVISPSVITMTRFSICGRSACAA